MSIKVEHPQDIEYDDIMYLRYEIFVRAQTPLITSHLTASRHTITLHHTAPHYITSHHTTQHNTTVHYATRHHTAAHNTTLHHTTSHSAIKSYQQSVLIGTGDPSVSCAQSSPQGNPTTQRRLQLRRILAAIAYGQLPPRKSRSLERLFEMNSSLSCGERVSGQMLA